MKNNYIVAAIRILICIVLPLLSTGCVKMFMTQNIREKNEEMQYRYRNNTVSCSIEGVETYSVISNNDGDWGAINSSFTSFLGPKLILNDAVIVFWLRPEIFERKEIKIHLELNSNLSENVKYYSDNGDFTINVMMQDNSLALNTDYADYCLLDDAKCEHMELVYGYIEFSRIKKKENFSKKDYAEGTFEFAFKMTVSGYPKDKERKEFSDERVEVEIEKLLKFENGKFKLY